MTLTLNTDGLRLDAALVLGFLQGRSGDAGTRRGRKWQHQAVVGCDRESCARETAEGGEEIEF